MTPEEAARLSSNVRTSELGALKKNTDAYLATRLQAKPGMSAAEQASIRLKHVKSLIKSKANKAKSKAKAAAKAAGKNPAAVKAAGDAAEKSTWQKFKGALGTTDKVAGSGIAQMAVFGSIMLVPFLYQLTHKPGESGYPAGVDPEDPLALAALGLPPELAKMAPYAVSVVIWGCCSCCCLMIMMLMMAMMSSSSSASN